MGRRSLGRKARDGFSLVELLLVVVIMGLLTAAAVPVLDRPIRDSQFCAFAAELTSNLILARCCAQMSGQSVYLDFEAGDAYRYRTVAVGEQGRHEVLALDAWETSYPRSIRNQLPAVDLPHPVRGDKMTRALTSTHAPNVVFASAGSSNATIVFSDGDWRAICAIVSGHSGRFRVFLWDQTNRQWIDYY